MTIFSSHRNSCRVSGSDWIWRLFLFFFFFSFAKMKLRFLYTRANPHFQLLRLLSILAYQPSNTHTLWEFFCISWEIRQVFLCSFESCQLVSEFSCHKTKTCCLEMQVGFPDPKPAGVGPLRPPSLSLSPQACLSCAQRARGEAESLSCSPEASCAPSGLNWIWKGHLGKPLVLSLATSDLLEFSHPSRCFGANRGLAERASLSPSGLY